MSSSQLTSGHFICVCISCIWARGQVLPPGPAAICYNSFDKAHLKWKHKVISFWYQIKSPFIASMGSLHPQIGTFKWSRCSNKRVLYALCTFVDIIVNSLICVRAERRNVSLSGYGAQLRCYCRCNALCPFSPLSLILMSHPGQVPGINTKFTKKNDFWKSKMTFSIQNITEF